MKFRNSKEAIDSFLKSKTLAIAGVSRNPSKFGSLLFKDLIDRGLKVFPLNPHMESFEDHICYPSLKALPEKPDGLVIVLPPDNAIEVVSEALSLGIINIWLQQGSESEKAIDLCLKSKANVVAGECLFMFKEPVTSFHKWHRVLWKLFGMLPR